MRSAASSSNNWKPESPTSPSRYRSHWPSCYREISSDNQLLDSAEFDHTLQCMIRTQIYLTKEEHNGICELARLTRKRQSELIRQAIDEYLTRKKPADKLAKIRKAKGIWKGRSDLKLSDLRKDFDRF